MWKKLLEKLNNWVGKEPKPKYKLFIDDERFPKTEGPWKIVRNSETAKDYVMKFGCPHFISFDHDLGGEDTAMIFIKWLVEKDIKTKGGIIPVEFAFNVHSANPVGAANIRGYLNAYLKFRDKELTK